MCLKPLFLLFSYNLQPSQQITSDNETLKQNTCTAVSHLSSGCPSACRYSGSVPLQRSRAAPAVPCRYNGSVPFQQFRVLLLRPRAAPAIPYRSSALQRYRTAPAIAHRYNHAVAAERRCLLQRACALQGILIPVTAV